MFRDEKTIYYLGIWPEDGWELWLKIDEGMGVLLGLGAEGACGGGRPAVSAVGMGQMGQEAKQGIPPPARRCCEGLSDFLPFNVKL